MSIRSDIEAMILQMQRQGISPRYILIGFDQYNRWQEELKEAGNIDDHVADRFMNCEVVICSSDVIEVVAAPADQHKIFSKDRNFSY